MSTYLVSGRLMQLHLEPIVHLSMNRIVGFEALSRFVQELPVVGGRNYEAYFAALTAHDLMGVIERQLEIYQKWHEQHPEIYANRTLFINVRKDLLVNADFAPMFIPFARLFDIAIEIDASACDLTRAMREEVNRLARFGVTVWMDDFADHEITHQHWDGVKLDKFAFWDAFDRGVNPLAALNAVWDIKCSRASRRLQKPVLLAEGIENEAHLSHAIKSGFQFGQGFYWREGASR